MTDPVFVLLTTYSRRDLAIRTVESTIDNLQYPDIRWLLYDDGSSEPYLHELRSLIEDRSIFADALNGERRGVGYGMNWGIARTRELGGDILVILEDDWWCSRPYDIAPHVHLLTQHEDLGLVRMGYLSPGVRGELISAENKLWLRFAHNPNFQYNYAGHPSIRHLRFHDQVGMFELGLAPGMNELSMCNKFNQRPHAPAILWDMEFGSLGVYHHIGSESLADIQPGT